ncbi:hypothetical protein JT358_00015 [Micrococcales bacterium 31B]|nr:hypothetical protein [Micrococcales bacterium 31B]
MAITLPISRFIQNYNQHLVEAEATDHVIYLVQRADRPTWVLETKHRAQAQAIAFEYLGSALAVLAEDATMLDALVNALMKSLPWVAFLPTAEARKFAQETTITLRACASVGRYAAFEHLLEDWQNTAEIWSDPDLASTLAGEIVEPLNIELDGLE